MSLQSMWARNGDRNIKRMSIFHVVRVAVNKRTGDSVDMQANPSL